MIVVATAKGFYIGPREPGDTFEIDDAILKVVDGKQVMPSWFRLATPAEEGRLESAEAAEARAEGTLSKAGREAAAKDKKRAKAKSAEADAGSANDLV